ncbi:Rft protein-domain-containing protein [Infundibulicybe gibba]|nr:Rft protein-domain-containing protein [Infundibulicybe gibba]
MPPKSSDSLVSRSFSSASSLVFLQLLSRLFTFSLNQALVRLVPPRAYGTAAIQLELLLSTILFLSREGVRNALLRTQATTSLSFLPLILGFPLALATSISYARFAGQETRSQPYFANAVGVYALAALLELLGEPMHNVSMAKLRTDIRVRAEGLGITGKTLATLAILVYDARYSVEPGSLALLAFAGGQLAYSTVLLLTYVWFYGTKYLWPHNVSGGSPDDPIGSKFDPETLRLSLTMTSQSVIKHVLTEGDKMVLSWFSPLQDQGGYAIAVNYGSLVARIIFQPIEETLRVYFSKILPSSPVEASNALTTLLTTQLSICFIFLSLAPSYVPLLIRLLLPSQYLSTSAPAVLSAWVWYIPVLALNGGLEAFISSAATPKDLNSQSRWMAVFSVIYISAALFFYSLGLGDASLVYANTLNLLLRIAYALYFISTYSPSQKPQTRVHLRPSHIFPPLPLALTALSTALLTTTNARRSNIHAIVTNLGWRALVLPPVLIHLSLGVTMGLASLGVWWVTRPIALFRDGNADSKKNK